MGAELLYALWETLYMVIVSTVLSGIFGSGVAILMIITGPSGLRPNAPLYRVLDVVVNLLRSFPFIILLIAIIPLTRIIVGTSIGSTASIVPLTIAATPFVARLMEGSLLEVDRGVVEAAKSFGARVDVADNLGRNDKRGHALARPQLGRSRDKPARLLRDGGRSRRRRPRRPRDKIRLQPLPDGRNDILRRDPDSRRPGHPVHRKLHLRENQIKSVQPPSARRPVRAAAEKIK